MAAVDFLSKQDNVDADRIGIHRHLRLGRHRPERCRSRFLYYINEIRSAVLVMHGEKAHSRYFGEAAYHYMVDGQAEGYKFVGQPNPNPYGKYFIGQS